MTLIQMFESSRTAHASILTGLAGALLLLLSMPVGRRLAMAGHTTATPNAGLFLLFSYSTAMLGVALYLAALHLVGLEDKPAYRVVVIGLFLGSILLDALVFRRGMRLLR